jgi:hypothetical protein
MYLARYLDEKYAVVHWTTDWDNMYANILPFVGDIIPSPGIAQAGVTPFINEPMVNRDELLIHRFIMTQSQLLQNIRHPDEWCGSIVTGLCSVYTRLSKIVAGTLHFN